MNNAQSIFFVADQVQGMAYYKNNQAENLIVFLHGWGGSAQSFTPLAQSLEKNLSPKKFDRLQLDLPGFGKSEMPPITGWDTEQYATWFAKWLDQFLTATTKDKKTRSYKNIVLYGHSFGCRVIVRYLLKQKNWAHPVILTGAAGIKHPLPTRAKLAQRISALIKPIKRIIPPRIKKIILRKIFKAHDWADAPKALSRTTSS